MQIIKLVNRFFFKAQKAKAKIIFIITGVVALLWFLVRVIPKPSRATYPCQRAAFPIASAFVIWITATVGGFFAFKIIRNKLQNHSVALSIAGVISVIAFALWMTLFPTNIAEAWAQIKSDNFVPAKGYSWQPEAPNQPVGIAQGIHPGRVIMIRDPKATRWAGNWKLNEDQWWLDKNTDQAKVDNMLSVSIKKLTGEKSEKQAWRKIFQHYNNNKRNLNRSYQPGETVAVKINLNNSSGAKSDNLTDASPQTVLAVVRQLVEEAKVPQDKIIVYDARRTIAPAILTKVWTTYKDVRFVQEREPGKEQPVNPGYGNYKGLEVSDWVIALDYSKGNYNEARMIPRQIKDATYLVNLAILKVHSYPYNYMEDRGEGETGVTLSAKNYFGSIRAPWELHAGINPTHEAVKNAYSPLVDLSASSNLGGKTILFLLDGLYSGRKWHSYPIHFPNYPFNNKITPYENPEWPSCLLVSQDQVAIESVGIDVLYAQSKNNTEPTFHNVPRIMFRDNTGDYLHEMATPDHAPSGVKYVQDGKVLTSLGVHEHWDNDSTMRYSRNIDPKRGKGIEFLYLKIEK